MKVFEGLISYTPRCWTYFGILLCLYPHQARPIEQNFHLPQLIIFYSRRAYRRAPLTAQNLCRFGCALTSFALCNYRDILYHRFQPQITSTFSLSLSLYSEFSREAEPIRYIQKVFLYKERFIMSNWFTQLWRLTNSKVYVHKLETQESWWGFQSESIRSGRERVSFLISPLCSI